MISIGDYQKYRWFFTSNNLLVIGGKNAEQNELLLSKFIKNDDFVLHTEKPGSPFCILDKKAKKQDLEETAVFCASFSQQWKKYNEKPLEIHVFRGKQIKKIKNQKIGTFSIVGIIKKIKAIPKLILTIQQEKIRAVPYNSKLSPVFAELLPGKLSKEKTALKIKDILKSNGLNISIDEIFQAIPSGGFELKLIKNKNE